LAYFCENLSRKHLRIQQFLRKFPTRGQGINSREQGMDSAFSTGAGNLA
jgi:hypothetical protein